MLLCERTRGSDAVRRESRDLSPNIASMNDLIRSRQRVTDHGEVFTPPELVASMIELVSDEASRIESRFLEPACGSGNFLVPVFERKLRSVSRKYAKTLFEYKNYALLSLMSIYGIEFLLDNVEECRENLLRVLVRDPILADDKQLLGAAKCVVKVNIVHADAVSMIMCSPDRIPITFAEWSYLGKGRFHRRDFRYDSLAQTAMFKASDTLFAELGNHDLFSAVRDYGTLSVGEILEKCRE